MIQRYDKNLALYTPQNDIQSMPFVTWLAEGRRTLPDLRIDMVGGREQSLTIQLAGSADDVTGHLMTKGWQRPPSVNVEKILGMLSPDTKID